MAIKSYTSVAASNTSLFPEGMAPSSVNDSARQVQADIRSWYVDAQWIDRGDSGISRASNSSFKITGDVTGEYVAGRRLKLYDATTLYGVISSSSYSAPDTTVNLITDSGNLTTSLTSVAVGILTPTNKSFPQMDFDTLTVSGASQLKSTATISGAAVLKTTLTVEGATTLSGAVTFMTTQTVSGAAVFKTTATVEGAATISGAAVLKTNLTVEGVTTLSGAAVCKTTLAVQGALTPSQTSGIVGTTTNNNADAGSVGEFVSSVVAVASAVSLTNGTDANVTSISLTAGDWMVWGNVGFVGNGTTTIGQTRAWSSTTSSTSPDLSLYVGENATVISPSASRAHSIPARRYSLGATTTVYLSCFAEFSGGAQTACGAIYARRLR